MPPLTNPPSPHLQIHVYSIDGSRSLFNLDAPELVDRALRHLQPDHLFTEHELIIPGVAAPSGFVPPLLTRVDLITDRLSVWDYPFRIGAPVELKQAQVQGNAARPPRHSDSGLPGDSTIFLDIQTVDGKQTILSMVLVGGLPPDRSRRIHGLLNERYLIFGLARSGIGVLNLANVTRFAVLRELPELAPALSSSILADPEESGQFRLASVRTQSQSVARSGRPASATISQPAKSTRSSHRRGFFST